MVDLFSLTNMKALQRKYKEYRSLKTNKEYFRPADLDIKSKPFNGTTAFISLDYICSYCSEVVRFPHYEHFYTCKRDKPNSNFITYLMRDCIEL